MYEVECRGSHEEYISIWNQLSDLCLDFQRSFLTLWLDRGNNFNYDFIRVVKDDFNRFTVFVSIQKDILMGMDTYLESLNLAIIERQEVLLGIPTISVDDEEKLLDLTSLGFMHL